MAQKRDSTPNTEQLALQELTIEQRQVEGLSLSTVVRRRFLQHRAAVTSLVVLGMVVLLAFTSVGTIIGGTGKLAADFEAGKIVLDGFRIPGWWQYNWYENYPITTPGGLPSWQHPFGQDTLGKDIFARVMRGIQQSLTVVTLIGVLATVIGVVVGSLAGFLRGWLDSLLMRMTDVIIIIPGLILGAVLGRTVGGNAVALGVLLGLVSWTGLARLVRGEFLALREREFVDAARVAGASNSRIIFRHILPNSIGVVVVNATLLMSAAILTETALSFLGFGITAPDISLGQIISEYNEAFKTRPWLFWWPGFFIVVIALCINFVGDGLRDAFDPRQRRMPKTASLPNQFREIMDGGVRQ
jgi:ABC-type dipeptide/oligopeptide/nickel transport system permease subunit